MSTPIRLAAALAFAFALSTHCAAESYTVTDLGTLGSGYGSRATGINSGGQVVGLSYTATAFDQHAFLYSDGSGMIDLGTLGGSNSYAYGINDSGQVVGQSYVAGSDASHVFLYNGGVMSDLGTFLPN